MNRDFFICLLLELGLKDRLILRVIKLLYGVLEASNYWFNIYYHYYLNKLQMNQLIYDPCLLYTTNNGFKIIGLQIDNILFLANETFVEAEETRL